MFGVIATSFKNTEVFILQEKVMSLQGRLTVLSQSITEKENEKKFINDQLISTQTKPAELSLRLSNKQEERQKKFQEMQEISSIVSILEREYEVALEKNKETKREHEYAMFKLGNIVNEINSINEKAVNINKAIEKLDIIINSSQPTPHYNITPGTCKHGHPNCPNLPLVNPGETTLLNQVEISEHKEAVAHARNEKIRLLTQKEFLLLNNAEMQKQYSKLEMEAALLQTNCWQLEKSTQDTQAKLLEQKRLQQQIENEHQTLIEEESKLQNQFINSQLQTPKLAQELESLNYKITNLKIQQRNIELEIQRLNDQLERLKLDIERKKTNRLEEIARRQLALEALARQELEKEAEEASNASRVGTSNVSTLFEKVSNITGAIQDAGTHLKEMSQNIMTTASDLYPSPVGTVIKTMFDGPHGINEEFFGESPTSTGNIIIDTVNKGNVPATPVSFSK